MRQCNATRRSSHMIHLHFRKCHSGAMKAVRKLLKVPARAKSTRCSLVVPAPFLSLNSQRNDPVLCYDELTIHDLLSRARTKNIKNLHRLFDHANVSVYYVYYLPTLRVVDDDPDIIFRFTQPGYWYKYQQLYMMSFLRKRPTTVITRVAESPFC